MTIDEIHRIKKLLDFCDQMKVYFRGHRNQLAEELYAHLGFKVGIMYEMIIVYVLSDTIEGHPTIERYHGKDTFVNEMKIYEIQNLIFPHFVSVIESSLRVLLLKHKKRNQIMILHTILEHLLRKKLITKSQMHLWDGIRHMRNAVVHYSSVARVSDVFQYYDDFQIVLKEGETIYTDNLYQDLKLMEWMAYNVKDIYVT